MPGLFRHGCVFRWGKPVFLITIVHPTTFSDTRGAQRQLILIRGKRFRTTAAGIHARH